MAEHFHALKVAAVIAETEDANSILFELPDALAEAFAFKAGQHVTLRADIDGEDVRRNYSLCVAPHEGKLQVTVKRIQGGVFSNWVGDHLKSGDLLDVMAPHGSFTRPFDAQAGRHYVGIAGGSGITPIISLIRTALSVEDDSRFTLFYGNRDSGSVIFLEALAALKDRYLGRFELYHFLSHEAGDVDMFNGMLDRETVDEAIDTLIRDPQPIDDWFICGPGPMMDAAEEALKARDVAAEKIHIERFTAGRPSAAQAAALAEASAKATGTLMDVTLDGRTRKVEFDGSNILDSARKSGLPAPFACKAGVCATCRAKIVKGKVDMAARYGLTDEEIAAGYVLTCQSVPEGDGVAVDYDV